MLKYDKKCLDSWGNEFEKYRRCLLALTARNLSPVLSRRFSTEDIVQDTLVAACNRIEFFENNPEIPVYIKLRTILLQTIANCERKHLQAQKRNIYKERESYESINGYSSAQLDWDRFADSVTSPLSKMARADCYNLLRQVLESLSDNDRQILTLRHFDGLSNSECAQALEIEPKTASIRYVRALQRLKDKLCELTEFQP